MNCRVKSPVQKCGSASIFKFSHDTTSVVGQSRLLNQEDTFGSKHELSDIQQVHARSCKYDLKLLVKSATGFSCRRLSLFVPLSFTILFNAGSKSWLKSGSRPIVALCQAAHDVNAFSLESWQRSLGVVILHVCFLIHGVRFSGLRPHVVADSYQFTAMSSCRPY